MAYKYFMDFKKVIVPSHVSAPYVTPVLLRVDDDGLIEELGEVQNVQACTVESDCAEVTKMKCRFVCNERMINGK
jgi:hypothetical protein